MDETLKKIYKTEIQLKKASYTATVLSLLVVLIGVIGLVSLSVQKRTKEIGIRKVLGSSAPGIVALFVKEFLLIILLAVIIAAPVSYFIMNTWLQGYAYRIGITLQPYLITLGLLLGITLVLVATQTIKAAMSNPIKSLRTE